MQPPRFGPGRRFLLRVRRQRRNSPIRADRRSSEVRLVETTFRASLPTRWRCSRRPGRPRHCCRGDRRCFVPAPCFSIGSRFRLVKNSFPASSAGRSSGVNVAFVQMPCRSRAPNASQGRERRDCGRDRDGGGAESDAANWSAHRAPLDVSSWTTRLHHRVRMFINAGRSARPVDFGALHVDRRESAACS